MSGQWLGWVQGGTGAPRQVPQIVPTRGRSDRGKWPVPAAQTDHNPARVCDASCEPGAPEKTMHPDRIVELDQVPPLMALTATTRGMIEHTFVRAAQRAWLELMHAVAGAGRDHEVGSRIGLLPDRPRGANDASCRYLAGVLFGFDLARQRGVCRRPELPLTGTLAWWPIATGRYAVFTHVGPLDGLHRTWDAIERGWLPGSSYTLGQAAPMELSLDPPGQVAPEALRTEIWIPVADR